MSLPLRVEGVVAIQPPSLQILPRIPSRGEVIDDLLASVPDAEDHLVFMGRFKALSGDPLVARAELYHPWLRTPMYSPGNTANVQLYGSISHEQRRELLSKYEMMPQKSSSEGPLHVNVGKAKYSIMFFSV